MTKMIKTAHHFIATVVLLAVLLPVANVEASDAQRRFYFGADIGVSVPNDLESTRTNNGIQTNCDQWLDRDTLNDGTVVPLPLEDCSPSALPGRATKFDLGTGLLAGANLGYVFHDFRFEVEYFRRQQSGGSSDLNVPNDPKQDEFIERSERVSTFRADNFFANVYYDLHNVLPAKFTPYLGAGLGVMHVRMDYSGASIRTSDRDTLYELGRNRHAAGLASLADDVLSDTIFGYQWIAGLDYAWSERSSIGFKFRYGDAFNDFKNGNNAWTPLRGHASTVGRPGTPGADLPIHYAIKAKDLSFFGISLNFKYFFDM